jgi:peptidoglycan/xylan/chitin deacetylase (PgdA/CDA1 family)
MWKSTAMKACFEAIYWSGAAHIMSGSWGGQGVIFCLHHVGPKTTSNFAPNANLETTPQFLEAIILLMKRKGYALLSLSEAVEQIRTKTFKHDRFAVFTLDDGYKDNFVHAMPVFTRHNCPFTVYVAPRIAEGTCELWWRGLEAIIAGSDHVSCQTDGLQLLLPTQTTEQKWVAWQTMAPRVQSMPEYTQREWISQMAIEHGVDLLRLCREAAMTWDELREMRKNPLATIGAHTLNHYNLLKLPEADARREIFESRAQIEAELGGDVKHFAYPYGNKDAAGPREFKLCEEAGYESAVVTRLGAITPDHHAHLFALPRIMVSSRFASTRHIDALISGVPGRLANGLRGLNVN